MSNTHNVLTLPRSNINNINAKYNNRLNKKTHLENSNNIKIKT